MVFSVAQSSVAGRSAADGSCAQNQAESDPASSRSSSARFAEHVHKTNAVLFKEWNDRGDRYLLAMDVTRFMMEGMAVGQLTVDHDKRVPQLLDYLGDRLEEIFKEGESSAIGRHSSRK